MRLGNYLSLAGTELANDIRTLSYIREASLSGWITKDCECTVYDDGPYFGIDLDPAPWYNSADERSLEFMGVLLHNMRALDPFSRAVVDRGIRGSSLGPLHLGTRVVTAEGTLVASSHVGMSYGATWVREVLRGAVCVAGCAPDDACVALGCDEGNLRMLRNVGIVDGPVFSDVGTPANCTIQGVSFQLASEMPFMYDDPAVLYADITLAAAGSFTDLISTQEWVADAALLFEFTAGATDATDLRIVIRTALEGTCPDVRVPPCYDVSIPTLPANSVLTIDATRQKIDLRDPITLEHRSGLHLLEFSGAMKWPEVPPCSDVCVTVSNGGAQNVTLRFESYGREI